MTILNKKSSLSFTNSRYEMRLSPSILKSTLLISTITQQQYILLENWEKTKNCFGFQHWFLITLFGTWHGFGWWRLILFFEKKGHIFVSVFLRIIFKTWLLIDEQNDDIEMYAFFYIFMFWDWLSCCTVWATMLEWSVCCDPGPDQWGLFLFPERA